MKQVKAIAIYDKLSASWLIIENAKLDWTREFKLATLFSIPIEQGFEMCREIEARTATRLELEVQEHIATWTLYHRFPYERKQA